MGQDRAKEAAAQFEGDRRGQTDGNEDYHRPRVKMKESEEGSAQSQSGQNLHSRPQPLIEEASADSFFDNWCEQAYVKDQNRLLRDAAVLKDLSNEFAQIGG